MAERFFEVNTISFTRDYLPAEEAVHNKDLHLTVKYEGYYMKRVMLDGGSEVDIYPLSTLQRMEIGIERIPANNVCVRAFDRVKRDTIGEIDLIITIGPVDFEMTFQVLDMETSYNFLLGRPWIYAAGVVPSTLYQMVKFEYDNQEIVLHGEDEQSIYQNPSVLCLEARESSEHIVYQAFEIVVVAQFEEGDPLPQPFLSNASIMVATQIIRNGYKPGKGLRASLQGITKPISPVVNEKFIGLGFQDTKAIRTWANNREENKWVLSHPIPHLAQSFIKKKYVEEEEATFMAEEINDICGALKQMLYDSNMVQPEECTSQLEYDEDEAFREINRELEQFDNKPKPKPNLNEIEPVNLVNSEEIRETMINIHADERNRDPLIQLLFEFKDVFAWVMPFDLKNTGAASMRAMTAIFHDMMHQEIEVYMDDVIIKSRMQEDHVRDMRKFFERLRKYDLKLNPAKCAFGVPSGKLLGL
ncbi:uncharacterized protein [Nicotiana sylvestris]|uniref:uncharacterized protein n=1 Tax=Nicotiana sylvestris TaxID=4096 RepID=UPI00388C8CEE